jgi:hypothetical protein
MNCAVHPDLEATGYCRECGKALCAACARPVRDVLYCEDCLATVVGHSAPAGAPPVNSAQRSSSNPGLAFVLGFCIPGLGAVYNCEYNKALIHIAIFAALIVGQTSVDSAGAHVMLAFMMTGFVFYMGFDAMHTARRMRGGQPSSDPLASWSKDRPVGAFILIGLGLLFLLSNFGFFDWDIIGRGWPVILIVVGVLLLMKRLGRSS